MGERILFDSQRPKDEVIELTPEMRKPNFADGTKPGISRIDIRDEVIELTPEMRKPNFADGTKPGFRAEDLGGHSSAEITQKEIDASNEDKVRRYLSGLGEKSLDNDDFDTADRIFSYVRGEIDSRNNIPVVRREPVSVNENILPISGLSHDVRRALEVEQRYRDRLAAYSPKIPRPPLRALLTKNGRSLWEDYRNAVKADKEASK